MTDHPREWPNVAREARDRTAEAAVMQIQELEPIVQGRMMTETELLRHAAKALNLAQRIARLMESQGACTRP